MLRTVPGVLTILILVSCNTETRVTPGEKQDHADRVAIDNGARAIWAADVARYLSINLTPSDPVEAVIWRGVRCDYLSRHSDGENALQARAIHMRMHQLRCGQDLRTTAISLREDSGDPYDVARLDALLAHAGPSG